MIVDVVSIFLNFFFLFFRKDLHFFIFDVLKFLLRIACLFPGVNLIMFLQV